MAKASKAAPARPDPREALRDFDEQVMKLHLEAVESVLPAKVEQTMRQWFSRVQIDGDDAESEHRFSTVLALAMALEAVTPSHSGATAYDRLARRRQLDPDEERALAALRASRFAPFRILSERRDGLFDARDLGTGTDFTLRDEDLPDGLVGQTLFGQLVPLPDGSVSSTGQEALLDDDALAVALDFVRPGRGIPNSHRCASAVYRHLVRNGGLVVPAFDAIAAAIREEALEPTALDGLAQRVIQNGAGQEPSAATLNEARLLASVDVVLEALFKAVQSGQQGAPKVGAVYRRFAEAMIETLDLRARAGSGPDRAPLDALASAIADEQAHNDYPPEAASLFRDIRRALGAPRPSEPGDDLVRVIERIRALRAKTVDQGCTEEEALSAADKVAELLDRYGLSLGETELRGQTCVGVGIESKRKRSGPLDDAIPAIADFCDCRSWQEQAEDGTIRSVFFGLPADVEAAQYLYDRVAAALDTETAAFRKGEFYGALASGGRQKATNSFQLGLARGIGAKLAARKSERDTQTFTSRGRDLVQVKAAVLDEELDKLGMAFTYKEAHRGRMVLRDAFEAGRIASGRFEIQSEIA